MKPLCSTNRYRERLIALGALTLVLFCPPILLIIDRLPSDGIGWLPAYLFTVWGVLIGLTAWLMEHRARR